MAFPAPPPVALPSAQPAPAAPPLAATPGCREYQSRAIIAGRAQETFGTACLQPDGSWRITQ
jgi:surface antigen